MRRTEPTRRTTQVHTEIVFRRSVGTAGIRSVERIEAGEQRPEVQVAAAPATQVTRDRLAGARLLATDARVAGLLMNEVRYRTLERLFGVSRQQANLLTLVIVLGAAEAIAEKSAVVVSGPAMPSATQLAVGASVGRGLLKNIAGPEAGEIPMFGTMVVIAVAGRLMQPALARSAHGARTLSHRARVRFNQRYGHLLASRHRR